MSSGPPPLITDPGDLPLPRSRRARLQRLRASETGQAGALAVAILVSNGILLLFTIVVTRVLGHDDYGALAALISAFLILLVGGQSVQAAAAREVALGTLGDAAAVRRTVRGWSRTVLLGAAALAVAGALTRGPLSTLIGTPEHDWAAAALPLTGAFWLLVSLQRGVLQGLQAFRPVALSLIGESLARTVFGVALAAVAGVTGAFLATALSLAVVALYLDRDLAARARVGDTAEPAAPSSGRTLRGLVAGGWTPIVGLLLLAVLQNVDVIIARHQLGHDRAGSYAVAAVAAKAVVWIAIGLGLQVLPQATVRAAAGLDPRPVLWRALGVLGIVSVPALLIFAVVPKLLLTTAFGDDGSDGAPALLILGAAMVLLAVTYLSAQFAIALGDRRFVWVLGVIAAAELPLLLTGSYSIRGFATAVGAVQLVAATSLLTLALLAGRGTGADRADSGSAVPEFG